MSTKAKTTSGTVTGAVGRAGAGPTATASGKVPGQPDVAGSHDFIANPKSAADSETGGRDFTQENRPQAAGTDDAIPEVSVPEGGKYIRDAFTPDAVGTGSVGNAHRPFKLK